MSSARVAREPVLNQGHIALAFVKGTNVFGDAVGVDVLETMDSHRRRYQCFNVVDLATGFQQLKRRARTESQARGGRAACHLEQQLQFKLRQLLEDENTQPGQSSQANVVTKDQIDEGAA